MSEVFAPRYFAGLVSTHAQWVDEKPALVPNAFKTGVRLTLCPLHGTCWHLANILSGNRAMQIQIQNVGWRLLAGRARLNDWQAQVTLN